MANLTVMGKGTKNERYKVMYDLPTLPGQKRKRASKTFPHGTKMKDIKDFIKEVEYQSMTAVPINNRDLTFHEATVEYFEKYTLDLQPYTVSGYRSIFEREGGLDEFFGATKLKKITTSQIQSYIVLLNNKGLSPKTISNTIGFLSSVLQHCVRLQYISYNPVNGTKLPPKEKNTNKTSYTPQEIQKLLQLSAGNNLLQPLIALGALAGLRRGEIAALTWDNVSLNTADPHIKIVQASYHVSPNVGLSQNTGIKAPKTTAGYRTIPIPDVLVKILQKQKTRYNTCKLRYGETFKDSNFVLFKDDGSAYKIPTLSNTYSRFINKQKEVPAYSMHTLRHSYASILINAGATPKTVQELLGHSDVAMTMNVYTHAFSSAKRTAADTLNNLVAI